MRSGTRSERKAREGARSPACGLAVSLRGRGSISKGDLFWIGSRADMPRHRHIIYNKSKQINAPTQDYFQISENYAAIREGSYARQWSVPTELAPEEGLERTSPQIPQETEAFLQAF